MKIPLLVGLVLIISQLTGCSSNPDREKDQSAGSQSTHFEFDGVSVDDAVAAEMERHDIVGLSLAIIENGEIVKAKGYGFIDRSKDIPVTTSTLFQAGSISKPVAALAVLRMVEEDRLSLDENVNVRLEQWQVPENKYTKEEKVTLRRILSHSAGLTVHGFPGYGRSARIPTLLNVLDGSGPANTKAIKVDIVPGEKSRYSGGGYTVMQQLMMESSGERFPELMQSSVLSPLQMTSSTYEQPLPNDRTDLAAKGHRSNGREVDGGWHVYPEMAAAGLWTTPSDLARFTIEIQETLANRSNAIISQSMVRQMLSAQKGNFGLGFVLFGTGETRRFWHGGRDEGFDATLFAYAETGQGVVVMINKNDNSEVLKRIVEAVRKEYRWPKPISMLQ